MPASFSVESPKSRFILVLECPDQTGIVAAVAAFLADRGLSIEESNQFHDNSHGDPGQFFMRTAFTGGSADHARLDELNAGFAPIGRRFNMNWRIHDTAQRAKIMVAVSRFGHCLHDLMHKQESGWLRADIVGVVSNHENLRPAVSWRGIPYHHIPVVDPATKPQAEEQLLQAFADSGAELLVLARYMQILSPEACAALAGRCINIHHSFLPSFKGARPYHQAHAKGVKIIGATAHYVTPDLDEGPIIEQAVGRISHHHSPQDLVEIGRDLECVTLSRAVRWHAERRVIVTGPRTVVFA
jgi:formyltetrahydrofolate deformylase